MEKGDRGGLTRKKTNQPILSKQKNEYLYIMEKSNYNKNLKSFAREHRSKGTKGEAVLWKYVLRASKTGFQFNRQFAIGNYIVDFISRKLKLIIEIDGSSHYGEEKSIKDFEREQYLRKLGYEILRFSERDVIYSKNEVAGAIFYAVEARAQELGLDKEI